MADNAPLPLATGSTRNAATDQVTYSGDVADVQLVRVVEVTGAEGSKTVISPNAVISTVNSSTALLLLSGTFTGTGEDVTEYSHIVVSVYASHASATDGLQLQQSTNGTNWDWVDSYTVPATTGKSFSAPVQGKFFRVVFTNGGIMQTDFRIATLYSKRAKKGSSVRPQDGRSNENDFEETLAYGMGWNGATWDRVKTTAGALNVIQPDATASGTLTALNDAVSVTIDGDGAWAVDLTGFVGHVVTFESQVNSGTAWRAINGALQGVGTLSITASADGTYRGAAAALAGVRARLSTTGTGSVTASARSSAGTSGTFLMAPIPTGSNSIGSVTLSPTTLWVTATAATGVAATASLPAVVGQFHYITAIDIQLYATAARTGGATPVIVTSTNLPGSPAFNFPTAQVIGAIDRYDIPLMTPIKSSVANTITTIAAPIATTGLWRINVGYYTGA